MAGWQVDAFTVLTDALTRDWWDGAAESLSIVHPLDDLIEHETSGNSLNCPCVPRWKITIGYHEEEGCLCVKTEVIHHSLDGRELSE